MSDYKLKQLHGAFAAGFSAAHGVPYPTGDPARRKALQKLKSSALLRTILRLEPRVGPILEEAKLQENTASYNRIRTYTDLRNKAAKLVGWESKNPALRTMKHYDCVVGLIGDLLPNDDVDLYPNGKPD